MEYGFGIDRAPKANQFRIDSLIDKPLGILTSPRELTLKYRAVMLT